MAINEDTKTIPEKQTSLDDRVQFWCSYCAQKYRLPKELAGKSGTCDKCRKGFIIPKESQAKPELKKTILFFCEHCGKKLWEPKELTGQEVECDRCGAGNLVPENSQRSRTEKIIDIPDFPNVKTAKKLAAKTANSKRSLLKSLTTKQKGILSTKKDSDSSENQSTISKIKNNITNWNKSKHPLLKPILVLAALIITAVILSATWNSTIKKMTDKNPMCLYDVSCESCGSSELRRFRDISKQTCTDCKQPLGFTYKCGDCKRTFACNEGERVESDEDEDDPIPLECPFCYSEDVHYAIRKKLSQKKK